MAFVSRASRVRPSLDGVNGTGFNACEVAVQHHRAACDGPKVPGREILREVVGIDTQGLPR